MKSIIQKISSKIIIRCSHKNCPVKYPEMCPINVPSPCPNHPEEQPLEDSPHEKNNKILGRWKPEDDFKKTAIKVDCANVDHCGPCGSEDVRNITSVCRKII
jgi:hypothetical protein